MHIENIVGVEVIEQIASCVPISVIIGLMVLGILIIVLGIESIILNGNGEKGAKPIEIIVSFILITVGLIAMILPFIFCQIEKETPPSTRIILKPNADVETLYQNFKVIDSDAYTLVVQPK